MQTLDNTGTQRQLYFRDRHRVWIGGERDLLRHSNAIEICYGTWSRTERSWHLLGRSSVGWFNLAAAIRVESKKPTGFILPAMRKPFCDTHRVHQACPSYGHTEPNKLFFMWYTSNLQPRGNNKVRLRDTRLESNSGPTSMPLFCFRAKRADELAGEL